MPVTVKFDPNVTSPQSAIIPDATVNSDRNLRLQYLAGLGLDLEQSGQIYLEMLQYVRFPDALFTGSKASLEAVRAAIDRAAGR